MSLAYIRPVKYQIHLHTLTLKVGKILEHFDDFMEHLICTRSELVVHFCTTQFYFHLVISIQPSNGHNRMIVGHVEQYNLL